MSETPFLSSDRLNLFNLSEKHCTETYLGWLHDQEVCRYLETGRYPQTIESLLDFINKFNRNEGLFLAIHTKENGNHIGNIKIDSINRIHQTAEYGILLVDKKSWGKGYAKEASELVLEHCFTKLNIRKITLGLIADNVSALNLYEKKLKFNQEGLLKKHSFVGGKFCDVIRMATFSEDWI